MGLGGSSFGEALHHQGTGLGGFRRHFLNTPVNSRICSELVRWNVPVRKAIRNTGEIFVEPPVILFSNKKTWTSRFDCWESVPVASKIRPKRPLVSEL